MSRTVPQPELDARAKEALLGYLVACGAEDPDAALRQWIAGDPAKHLKHVRVLFRGLLFGLFEREMHAERSRLYVAWAEAGFPDPPPQTLGVISEDDREYALKVWRQSVKRLASMGLEPVELLPPTAGQQKGRKNLRRKAEDAAKAPTRDSDELRAAALRAVAAFHATDAEPPVEQIERAQRAAACYELRSRGPVEITFEEAPHLRPNALRAALAAHPPPEINDALTRLAAFDLAAATRLRNTPWKVPEADLALLVAETATARRKAGLSEATRSIVTVSETDTTRPAN